MLWKEHQSRMVSLISQAAKLSDIFDVLQYETPNLSTSTGRGQIVSEQETH